LLLKKGRDIDLEDVNGRTPLSLAAEKGHEAVVKLLLANDDVDPDSKDIYGRTPLSWAARSGHEAVVRLLLAKGGVDLNTKDTEYGPDPRLSYHSTPPRAT
jgi:ankyrin repeat protein